MMKSLGVSLVRGKLGDYLDALRNIYASQLILSPKEGKPDPKPSLSSNTDSMKSRMENLAMNDAMKSSDNKTGSVKVRSLCKRSVVSCILFRYGRLQTVVRTNNILDDG